MAMIPRSEMVNRIRAGGVVLLGGQFIGREEDLPSEAQLAQGDPAKEAAAREALDAQIKALQDARASLDRPAPAPVVAPDPEPASREVAPAEAPKPPKGK